VRPRAGDAIGEGGWFRVVAGLEQGGSGGNSAPPLRVIRGPDSMARIYRALVEVVRSDRGQQVEPPGAA
jgi:hypothetical protein